MSGYNQSHLAKVPTREGSYFPGQLQKKLGILAVSFWLANSLGLDLRRIADPHLDTQLCQ
jgi:hypothetical protein